MKLTGQQRKEFKDGEAPAITGTGKCPVEPGFRFDIVQNLYVVVREVRIRRGGGWSLAYVVYDNRDPDKLPRRTPPMLPDGTKRWLCKACGWIQDQQTPKPKACPECQSTALGWKWKAPEKGPSSEEIAKAGLESSYTSSAKAAVPDIGASVPDDWQRKLTKDAEAKAKDEQERRRKAQALLPQEDRIRDLLKEANTRNVNVRSERRMLERLLAQGKPVGGQVRALERRLNQHVDRKAA